MVISWWKETSDSQEQLWEWSGLAAVSVTVPPSISRDGEGTDGQERQGWML